VQKTFLTSKTKHQILEKLDFVRMNLNNKASIYNIHFSAPNKIRVVSGRSVTYWILDSETEQEITARKFTTPLDWLKICSFAVIDAAFAYLLFSDGAAFIEFIFLMIIILIEFLLYYLTSVYAPLRIIRRFLRKYIDEDL
jgi:hypothetical protein